MKKIVLARGMIVEVCLVAAVVPLILLIVLPMIPLLLAEEAAAG